MLAVAVVAVVLAGSLTTCSSPSGDDEPPVEPTPIQDVRIEGVRASQPDRWAPDGSNWEVTITWYEPDVAVDHYEITRDDVLLDNDVQELSYTDGGAPPGERIRYEIVGLVGDASSLPGGAGLRTGEPTLAQARFDGTFNVDVVAVDWSTTIVEPKSYRAQFIFKPECAKSTWFCDVSWDEYYGTAEGTLERRGSTYVGEAFGTLNLPDCRTGKKLDARLEIDVKVLRAAAADGWYVDDFKGTIVESLPASATCPAVWISWRFDS